MGGSLSKAAEDVSSVIGNAVAAPFKSVFGRTCKDVCSGIWDVFCFIEHICISDLVKLLLVCVVCYVVLIFIYLLFKVGICKCVMKSICKMWWAACETYWFALEKVCCFCLYKLSHTKRVYRGRRRRQGLSRLRDVELGYCTCSDEIVVGKANYTRGRSLPRKRKYSREKRAKSMRYASRRTFSHFGQHSARANNRFGSLSHRSPQMISVRKYRGQVSVRLRDGHRSQDAGNMKQLRIKSLNHQRRKKVASFKRRKI